MTDASSVYQDSLPISSDTLIERLEAEGYAFELFHHVPLRTVADSKLVEASLGAHQTGDIHIKNLYLRNKKKKNLLVVLEQDYELDLRGLGPRIGMGNLSFGSPERLLENLGVRPGAVTPLAMATGCEKGVTLWMDVAIRDAGRVFMHPLVNDRTVAMQASDLQRFLESLGVSINWLEPF